MSMILHTYAKKLMMQGDLDLLVDTIKVMACTNFTDVIGATSMTAIAANELPTANGYTVGGITLSGKSVDQNDTDNRAYFKFTDPFWTAVGTLTARKFVYFKFVTNMADSIPIITVDKGSNQSRTDTAFTLLHNAKGLFGL